MTRPALLLLVALAACGAPEPEAAPVKTSGTYASDTPSTGVVETDATEPMTPFSYVDVTAEAGIDFTHENGATGKKLLPETMGPGCVFFDYDDDDDADLLLLNGRPWALLSSRLPPTSKLYRNDGDFHFTDVTEAAGLTTPFYALGAAAADADGDGDTDLFITGVGGYRYLRNDWGVMTDVTAESGLDPGLWTDAEGGKHGPFATSAAFVDVDRDGRPDLFVCHYVRWSEKTDVWTTMDGTTKSYATPKQYPGESCRLWRNLGGNRFEDITDEAGVRNDEGKSLGVAIVDWDRDGWPDIAVANDTQPDYFYVNQGDGTFVDEGTNTGMAFDQKTARARAGMGIDSARLGDDLALTLAVGNFSGEPVAFWQRRRNGFKDRADVSGVSLPTHHPLTFGVRFLDADLDGRQDLVFANGHIEPTIQDVHADIPYEQPMVLLRDRGDGRYTDVSSQLGAAFTKPRVGRGLAAADVDGDGDLDLCVTTCGGPAVLLRCDQEGSAARSLRVRVSGTAPATDALGARVRVEVAGRPVQEQTVRTGSGYLSQSELILTFGLANVGKAEKVTVTWPDGAEKTFEDVSAGTLVASP